MAALIAMLCCSIASAFEVDGIYYSILSTGDKTVKVTYRGNSWYSSADEYSGSVVIPSSVIYNGNTYSVSSIGDYAFRDCSGLTSITIPEGVTSIGYLAFGSCDSLTSITIPNSVSSIGDYAFDDCYGLTSITIPEGVTSIGDGAFDYCTGLTSITIPNSVTSIGEETFNACNKIMKIVCNSTTPPTAYNNTFSNKRCILMVPEGTEALYKEAAIWKDFLVIESSSIASAENFEVGGIYYSILSIEDKTVEVTYRGNSWDSYDDEYSGSVVIPSSVLYNGNTYSVTSIGYWTFYGCSGLKEITIPESVTSIGHWAFYGCSGLKEITIPEGVTSIGHCAFQSCSGLKEITIPEGVTSIGNHTFYNCSSLTSITIPNSVTSIGDYAFQSCDGLTSITIPNSVTSIGSYAFYDCDGLTSITIPNSVTSIGSYAFSECSSLTSITIPNSVTSIGDYAFWNCSRLTSITIPGSLTSFGGITNYAKTVHITLTDLAAWIRNPSFLLDKANIHLYLNGEEITELTIPNDVTTIKDKTFLNHTSLTSVTIPEGMTEIGDEAFMGCSNIKKIVCNATTPPTAYYDTFTGINKEECVLMVPEGTEALYKETAEWKDFIKIEAIPIEDNGIRYKATSDNTVEVISSTDKYSSKIVIPETVIYAGKNYSVTSIGDNAFEDCPGLTSITIPNSVTSIGSDAFYNCSGLTSITIPESVTSIVNGAFFGCSGLTSITIPNSVTSIGEGAFCLCNGLTSINIPEGVTSIGNSAFMGCSSLESVYSQMNTPCAYPGGFVGSPVLYIPAGTRDLYIEQGWDNWASEIVEMEIETETDSMLEMPDTEVVKGGANVLVPVSMENEESITAFQLEVSLPDGVTMTGCELSARKATDHSVSFSTLPNGNYQVVCISLTNKPFSGTEGVLVNLQLSTDKEMAVGSYEMGICNIELSTTAAEVLTQEDFTATLSVIDVEMGDTNGDGKISITDAVAIVNYILGNPSANYVAEASDVNGDGRTSITDAVAIVNKILSGESEAKDRMARKADLLDPQ